MLHFNEFGLLSEGIHKAHLTEFERLFGFNPKRREMIQKGLHPFIGELKPYRVSEIYLDGSFVTREENPDDLDGYALTRIDSKLFTFILENHDRWHEEYRIDFYAALTDEEGEASKDWWESWFSKTSGQNIKKGYVALTISSKGGGSDVANKQ